MSGKKPLIQEIEQAQLKTDVPEFGAGDTVTVQVKVKEGTRERLQAFQGVVIARRNRGLNSAFTVRKVSHGVGVERVFQLHSPIIDSIEVNRRGDVRRAKLYFLRDRSGKSARIKEKMMYASSKENLKRKLNGIQVEVQATDASEIEQSVMHEKCMALAG